MAGGRPPSWLLGARPFPAASRRFPPLRVGGVLLLMSAMVSRLSGSEDDTMNDVTDDDDFFKENKSGGDADADDEWDDKSPADRDDRDDTSREAVPLSLGRPFVDTGHNRKMRPPTSTSEGSLSSKRKSHHGVERPGSKGRGDGGQRRFQAGAAGHGASSSGHTSQGRRSGDIINRERASGNARAKNPADPTVLPGLTCRRGSEHSHSLCIAAHEHVLRTELPAGPAAHGQSAAQREYVWLPPRDSGEVVGAMRHFALPESSRERGLYYDDNGKRWVPECLSLSVWNGADVGLVLPCIQEGLVLNEADTGLPVVFSWISGGSDEGQILPWIQEMLWPWIQEGLVSNEADAGLALPWIQEMLCGASTAMASGDGVPNGRDVGLVWRWTQECLVSSEADAGLALPWIQDGLILDAKGGWMTRSLDMWPRQEALEKAWGDLTFCILLESSAQNGLHRHENAKRSGTTSSSC
ncbi:hypothetical protein CBR_g527 [Chara braunii]|uniref:Uncharacterized protein n=1 Tax=Chara braunii TaxID=69332 RepID=A0A388KBG4_CHABU|nr:hypothetical protein CBR_g527 [Chara braunii]|eukprot:GBG67390.1 hypothetical protein CBR_g527 [Chara braunii]